MQNTLILAFTGIAIVFMALIFLVFVIWLFSLRKKERQKDTSGSSGGASRRATSVKAAQTAPSGPDVESGIPQEIVAVIAAAVASMGGGSALAIRSIRRERTGRPAWAAAGIGENTRPFSIPR